MLKKIFEFSSRFDPIHRFKLIFSRTFPRPHFLHPCRITEQPAVNHQSLAAHKMTSSRAQCRQRSCNDNEKHSPKKELKM